MSNTIETNGVRASETGCCDWGRGDGGIQ